MMQDMERTGAGGDAFGDLERARQGIIRLAHAAEVTRMDVAALRRDIAGEVSLERDEIEALFALDRALDRSDGEWTEFLVRAVTDHVVWASRPTGIVGERDAQWLLAAADGSRTATTFAVLVNVLEEADRVPGWFAGAVRKRAVADWPGLDELGHVDVTIRRVAA